MLLLTGVACGPTIYDLPDEPITDAGTLLERYADRKGDFADLSAVARMNSRSSRGTVRGRVTFLAEIHGRIRVDGWTPTDSLVASLTADEHGFMYFERDADECLTGPSCPENLALLLPAGLGVKGVAGLLFGLPPIPEDIDGWKISFDRRVGAYELVSESKDGSVHRLWLYEDGAPGAAESRTGDGRLTFRMEAGDFKPMGGNRFPMKIKFKSDRDDTDLTVKYRSLELDPDILEDDWSFECPEGLGIRTVRCRTIR